MKKQYILPIVGSMQVTVNSALCASGSPIPYSPVNFKANNANPSNKAL